jgi:hypothetical protein
MRWRYTLDLEPFAQHQLLDPYLPNVVWYPESTNALDVLCFFIVGQPDLRVPRATLCTAKNHATRRQRNLFVRMCVVML